MTSLDVSTPIALVGSGVGVAFLGYLTWLGKSVVDLKSQHEDHIKLERLKEMVLKLKERQDERVRVFEHLIARVERLEEIEDSKREHYRPAPGRS